MKSLKPIYYIKSILFFLLFIILAIKIEAQVCQDIDSSNNWVNSWVSCDKSTSPNPERPNSHWLLYEFDEPQAINTCHIWNANRKGESNMGLQEAIFDYSIDGTTWNTLGSFDFPRSDESAEYAGFEGPDFGGIFVTKILITVTKTHGNTGCASLSEIQFNINTGACYGNLDACGVCNGEGETTWYIDQDGDGLGSIDQTVQSCEQPIGFVSNSNDDCDTGVVGWNTIGKIFEDNGCTGCHSAAAAGGLNLTTYQATIAGGNKCGTEILTGTTLVDIITTDSYSGCGETFIGPSMNARVGGQIDDQELALIRKWVEDGAPEDCQCPLNAPDSDGDGVCDIVDECPNLDNSLIGTPCDDGSDCTLNDRWGEDCNCSGDLIDSDNDGICDMEDAEPNNPCTADGVIDGIEPEDWIPNPENDCDLDGVSVAVGDLDDFSACVDQVGTLNTAICNCGDTVIDEGGILFNYSGINANQAQPAEGLPDGNFTGNMFNNDTVTLQFPFMEVDEEICLTLGFSSGNGEARVFLNNRLMTLIGDGSLNDYQPQEFCFKTFDSGIQTLIIMEDGPGNMRIDGSKYLACPCSGGNENDIKNVACLANYENVGWRQIIDCTINICEGESLVLGTDRYETVEFRWTGPNGFSQVSSTINFEAVKPSDSGFYWIFYQNPSGCHLNKRMVLNVLPRPTVNAEVIQPSCGRVNGEIRLTFTDHPSQETIEFSVEGPDGNFSEIPDNLGNFIYSGLNTGTYDVWARWSTGECPVNVGTFLLEDQPAPTLISSQRITICEGEPVILSPGAIGNDLSYTWSTGSKSSQIETIPIPSGYADEKFAYKVTVTDGNGCSTNGKLIVKVLSNPKVIVDVHHLNGEEHGAVTFNFPDHPDRTRMEFSINGVDGDYHPTVDNIGSFSITDLERGTYDAWVRWENGECPVNLGNFIIRNTGECPEIRAESSESLVCEGTPVTLSVNTASGWSYSWSNGSNRASQTIIAKPSSYADEDIKYSVIVTDKNGCSREDKISIKVRSHPHANFTVNHPMCNRADGSINFRFQDHPTRKKLEFSVTGKDGIYKKSDDNAGSFTITNLLAGRYSIWARWNNETCPIKLGDVELVNIPGPTVDARPNTVEVCEGESVNLWVKGTDGLKYKWSNGFEGPVQDVIPVISKFENKTLYYTVIGEDKNGCVASDRVTVKVLSKPRVTVGKTSATCGRADGSINFSFQDHPRWKTIEFSINGKDGPYIKTEDKNLRLTVPNLKAGGYSVWARWGNDDCQIHLGTVQLPNVSGPIVEVSPSKITICEGESVELEVDGRNSWTYTWNNGVKTKNQIITPTISKYEDKVLTYTVKAVDNRGCVGMDKAVVKVLSKPRITMDYVNPSCGKNDGSMVFTIQDHPNQRGVEVSLNGKNGFFRNWDDNVGTFVIDRLPAGSYNPWVRWKNDSCPMSLGSMKLIEKDNCNSLITSGDRNLSDLMDGLSDQTKFSNFNIEEFDNQKSLNNEMAFRSTQLSTNQGLDLLQVFPNPLSRGNSLTIKYYSEQGGQSLRILNVAGQEIKTIEKDLINVGWNNFVVNLSSISTGTYIIMDKQRNYKRFVVIE